MRDVRHVILTGAAFSRGTLGCSLAIPTATERASHARGRRWLLYMDKDNSCTCSFFLFFLRSKVLKGYSSGQSHISEINAKLAEENEFVTHFVQKCLETRENDQNRVLNESSEAHGNSS